MCWLFWRWGLGGEVSVGEYEEWKSEKEKIGVYGVG